MISIYLITNTLNGKKYVGQTIKTPEARFKEHCFAASPLGHAICQYGADKFRIEVVDHCATPQQANEREKFFISKYDCLMPKGYNRNGAGRTERVNLSLTEELKDRLSVLAAIDNITPTALAAKVLSDYVDARAEEIDIYTRSLEQIRNQYPK